MNTSTGSVDVEPQAGIGLEDFERVRTYLAPAVALVPTEMNLDELHAGIAKGEYQLWSGPHSALVTEVIDFPRERVLHFTLAGGHLAEIEAMLPPILAWGREIGATRTTLAGREGWQRAWLTKKLGWKVKAVVMEAELI